MSHRSLPHSKRPREMEGEAEKENSHRAALGAAAPPVAKKALTVLQPFRAARGVAASHRRDTPKSELPASIQHTPVSSTRTSGSSADATASTRRVVRPVRHPPPGFQSRTPAPPTTSSKANRPAEREVADAHTTPAAPASVAVSEADHIWQVKRTTLAASVRDMEATNAQLEAAAQTLQDVVESMLCAHEADLLSVQEAMGKDTVAHENALRELEEREIRCRALKSRSLEEIETLQQRVLQIKADKERVQEQTVLAHETITTTQQVLVDAQEEVRAARARLADRQAQEEKMKDTSYGLSGEVKEMVLEMQKLHKERQDYRVAGMEMEVRRRELYSRCEELKGAIRVYCRVKGRALPAPAVHAVADAPKDAELSAPTSTRTTVASTAASSGDSATPPHRLPHRETAANDEEADDVADAASDGAGAGATVDDLAEDEQIDASEHTTTPRREDSLASSVATTWTCASSARDCSDSGQDARARAAARPPSRSGPGGALTTTSRTRLGESEPARPFGGHGSASGGSARARKEGPGANRTEDDADTPVYTFEGTAQDFGADPASAAAVTRSASPVPTVRSASQPTSPTNEDALNATTPTTRTVPPPASLHRTIHVHSVRANATSTGRLTSSESFTFDRVFDDSATQADVYHAMEPLVHSAVDGYAVCVFAYGQTGSGKTYTMEGDMHHPERFGAIPRALETIFARQEVLSKEGWRYDLTCYFVEIYNDTVRDLLQSPSVYESGGVGYNNSHYHSIKHADGKTQITHVRERPVRSMDEFRKIHRQATLNRRTAKTQLNERSSRSHSIFTLHICGVNSTIGQKSEGVLCLIDLAGSERVNESGVHGQQFKETVSINRSLLDLGKCISAMRSGGAAVAPWRNSKLTYLLQHYLGAKGAKMLMLVNVSNERRHVPESLNALRFATRVSETVVGSSVKRVTNL